MEVHVECLVEEARIILSGEELEIAYRSDRVGLRSRVAKCVELCQKSGAATIRADRSDGNRGGVFATRGRHPEAIANLIIRELLS